MIAFKTIRARAEKRKGGAAALEKLLPPVPVPAPVPGAGAAYRPDASPPKRYVALAPNVRGSPHWTYSLFG